MWLPFYVLFLAVAIVVAIFAIKLIVSLRVAHSAPAWVRLGDQRSMSPERVLADADAQPVPVAKRTGQSKPKQPGKRKNVASKVAA
jgi:hypothetical protein